jgi:hypothetical protein
VDLFRTIIGRPIGDTGMGLCGVVSSTLILFEYGLAAVRAEREATTAPAVTQPAPGPVSVPAPAVTGPTEGENETAATEPLAAS